MARDSGDASMGRGHLANNIMQFCRALRAAGLPVGPGQTLSAIDAVRTVGVGDRACFYWALHASLVTRREQRELFDQAFHLFWRNPDLLKRAMAMVLPEVDGESPDPDREPVQRRVAEAFQPPDKGPEPAAETELEFDASLTVSEDETLAGRDFEQMSAAEVEAAKRLIAAMDLPVPDRPTRRFTASKRSKRIDPRASFRRALRGDSAVIDLAHRRRRVLPPPIVALCDVSGSMSRYSRMLLHFLHAITGARDRVHSFVFGTQLTNITRLLAHRDVDQALSRVGAKVTDWSGGTRIGACLAEFNRHWGRRVLGQGAVVLLITDGLDRDAGTALAPAVERLHGSCRQFIWLNPLLRWDGYAPKSAGARILIRHVDQLRTVHNLDSLTDLVGALGATGSRRDDLSAWRARAEDAA